MKTCMLLNEFITDVGSVNRYKMLNEFIRHAVSVNRRMLWNEFICKHVYFFE